MASQTNFVDLSEAHRLTLSTARVSDDRVLDLVSKLRGLQDEYGRCSMKSVIKAAAQSDPNTDERSLRQPFSNSELGMLRKLKLEDCFVLCVPVGSASAAGTTGMQLALVPQPSPIAIAIADQHALPRFDGSASGATPATVRSRNSAAPATPHTQLVEGAQGPQVAIDFSGGLAAISAEVVRLHLVVLSGKGNAKIQAAVRRACAFFWNYLKVRAMYLHGCQRISLKDCEHTIWDENATAILRKSESEEDFSQKPRQASICVHEKVVRGCRCIMPCWNFTSNHE